MNKKTPLLIRGGVHSFLLLRAFFKDSRLSLLHSFVGLGRASPLASASRLSFLASRNLSTSSFLVGFIPQPLRNGRLTVLKIVESEKDLQATLGLGHLAQMQKSDLCP
jgi:hypothetical protein